jgi:tetratricopeptide (TPR) repeat protein
VLSYLLQSLKRRVRARSLYKEQMQLALLALLALTSAPARASEPPTTGAAEETKGSGDAPAEPVVVLIMPFTVDGGSSPYRGVAVAEALIDEVAQANRDSFYTLLQLAAVLRRRDLTVEDQRVPELATELSALLAATDIVTGTIKTVGDRIEINAARTRGGKAVKQAHVEGANETLPVLGRQLAQRLLGVSSRLPPMAKNAEAMERGAECAALASAQPLGPRGRAFSLGEPQLEQLEKVCKAALALDPDLGLARGGASIALSLRNSFPPPVLQKRFVPLVALAVQFAARRSGKAALARSMLEDMAAAHPGFLQALGYLGEERLETRDDQAALVAFERYLARAPGQPWVMAQKAHAYARLGRKGEAVALSKAALARDPGDPELSIELASRLIDDGNDAEAEPLLRSAMAANPPRPLAALRLGFLELRRQKLDEARKLFQMAVDKAKRPDEIGVRAVAHADLARIAARRDDVATTIRELDAARAAGLIRMPCGEPDFQRVAAKPGMAQACAAPAQASGAASEDDMSVPVDL